MKNIIFYFPLLVIVVFGFNMKATCQSSPALWIQQAGLNGYGADDPTILHDGEDHLYFLGHFYKSFKYDDVILEEKGYNNIYVSKLDTSGNLIWIKRLWYNQMNKDKHLYNCNINCAAVDSDRNLYLTGSFEDTLNTVDTAFYTVGEDHDIYVMKFNPNGEMEWFYNMEAGSPTYQRSLALCIDENNDILLATRDHSEKHMFKFNSSGEVLWSKWFNSLNYNSDLYSMATDKDNNIYMSGRFEDYLVFEDDTLYSMAGDEYNGFYAKFDENGEYLWSRLIGSYCRNYSVYPRLRIDPDLNILIVCGISDCAVYIGSDSIMQMDEHNELLVKVNQEGEVLWWHQAYANQNIGIAGFELDYDNNIYLAVSYSYCNYIGFSDLVYPGEGRFLLIKMDPDGEILWVKNPGGNITWDLRLRSIHPDLSDNLYLTGHFSGLAIFGDTSFYSPGFIESIFLAKINEHSWIKESGFSSQKFPSVTIGPNPTDGSLEVNFHEPLEFEYVIYDIHGKLMNSGQVYSGKARIDLQTTPPGIYFLLLKSGHNEKVIKFIKK